MVKLIVLMWLLVELNSLSSERHRRSRHHKHHTHDTSASQHDRKLGDSERSDDFALHDSNHADQTHQGHSLNENSHETFEHRVQSNEDNGEKNEGEDQRKVIENLLFEGQDSRRLIVRSRSDEDIRSRQDIDRVGAWDKEFRKTGMSEHDMEKQFRRSLGELKHRCPDLENLSSTQSRKNNVMLTKYLDCIQDYFPRLFGNDPNLAFLTALPNSNLTTVNNKKIRIDIEWMEPDQNLAGYTRKPKEQSDGSLLIEMRIGHTFMREAPDGRMLRQPINGANIFEALIHGIFHANAFAYNRYALTCPLYPHCRFDPKDVFGTRYCCALAMHLDLFKEQVLWAQPHFGLYLRPELSYDENKYVHQVYRNYFPSTYDKMLLDLHGIPPV